MFFGEQTFFEQRLYLRRKHSSSKNTSRIFDFPASKIEEPHLRCSEPKIEESSLFSIFDLRPRRSKNDSARHRDMCSSGPHGTDSEPLLKLYASKFQVQEQRRIQKSRVAERGTRRVGPTGNQAVVISSLNAPPPQSSWVIWAQLSRWPAQNQSHLEFSAFRAGTH